MLTPVSEAMKEGKRFTPRTELQSTPKTAQRLIKKVADKRRYIRQVLTQPLPTKRLAQLRRPTPQPPTRSTQEPQPQSRPEPTPRWSVPMPIGTMLTGAPTSTATGMVNVAPGPPRTANTFLWWYRDLAQAWRHRSPLRRGVRAFGRGVTAPQPLLQAKP